MTREELAERLAVVVITDPDCGPERQVVSVVRTALQGGASAIQLRMKEGSAREMAELGRVLRDDTRQAGALLFVNDRLDVALAIGADGVHLGADDLPVAAARAITPEGFLIGRSVDAAAEVQDALAQGPDYLGAGPVFPTGSKDDAGPVMGVAGLESVVRAAGAVPVVGIGGIDIGRAGEVAGAGAAGVAVIGAVMRAPDPRTAAEGLLRGVRGGR